MATALASRQAPRLPPSSRQQPDGGCNAPMIIRYAQQEPYKKSQVAAHISRLVRGPSRRCTCEGWMGGEECSS